jgi:serine/threonine-protein kinase
VDKIGKFQVVREIAGGAEGVVHHCSDPDLGRDVAIKVTQARGFAGREQTEAARQRFVRGAKAAARLRHPNIVIIYDYFQDADAQYIVMELIAGKPLAPGMGADYLPVLRQIASALDYGHAQGVVHRDIKPSNVLVGAGGHVTVTDFGIARIAAEKMTRTNALMGTPEYMAPEQVMSSQVDGKADQFSLAVIAFELLTGRLPFEGETAAAALIAVVQAPCPVAHEVNRSLPPAVSEVLSRALAKDPNRRFATCVEFIAALEQALRRPAPAAVVPGREETRIETVVEPGVTILERIRRAVPSSKLPGDLRVDSAGKLSNGRFARRLRG